MVSRVIATGEQARVLQGVSESQSHRMCDPVFTLLRVAAVSLARGEKPLEAPTTDVVQTIMLLQSTYKEWVEQLLNSPSKRDCSAAYEKRNGLVYKADALCVLNDSALRMELMRMHHDDPLTGHDGANKTTKLIGCKYWWPSMHKDVKEYTSTCGVC